MAGALSARQGGAQFATGGLRVALKFGISLHFLHQRLRGDSPGDQVAGEVHTADHALTREFARPCVQLEGAFGRHVGEQVGHRVAVGRMSAGV